MVKCFEDFNFDNSTILNNYEYIRDYFSDFEDDEMILCYEIGFYPCPAIYGREMKLYPGDFNLRKILSSEKDVQVVVDSVDRNLSTLESNFLLKVHIKFDENLKRTGDGFGVNFSSMSNIMDILPILNRDYNVFLFTEMNSISGNRLIITLVKKEEK